MKGVGGQAPIKVTLQLICISKINMSFKKLLNYIISFITIISYNTKETVKDIW